VILTDEQQAHLLGFLKQGAAKARMLTRAPGDDVGSATAIMPEVSMVVN
jgi:hypothetical protein